jgi:hypothetical protein
VKTVEFKLSSKGSLFARNVARGNWTSPVLSSCPAGLLAVNQQDKRNGIYKSSYMLNLQYAVD